MTCMEGMRCFVAGMTDAAEKKPEKKTYRLKKKIAPAFVLIPFRHLNQSYS